MPTNLALTTSTESNIVLVRDPASPPGGAEYAQLRGEVEGWWKVSIAPSSSFAVSVRIEDSTRHIEWTDVSSEGEWVSIAAIAVGVPPAAGYPPDSVSEEDPTPLIAGLEFSATDQSHPSVFLIGPPSPAGDLVLARTPGKRTDLTRSLAQAVASRLRMWRGEWFLDPLAGVPYREEFLIKNPRMATLKQRISDAILSVPGIRSIDRLDLSIDSATRKLAVQWKASAADGYAEGEVAL